MSPKQPKSEPVPLAEALPATPVPVHRFLQHVQQHPDVPVRELLQPFLLYEQVLRAYFAQKPDHEFVRGAVNLISLFDDGNAETIKIRARDLAAETAEEKQRYIMPLKDGQRKKTGEPALVRSLAEFRANWNIFTEGSLTNLDWTNVVAAGSSVLTPLMKVPEEHAGNKKALRDYYHQKLAPASDIDLFLHGIKDREQAIAKMEQIEKTIKDNLLCDVTTLRTRNTITIVSEYPNRHVQIVLRLYDSPSQILTGFDVDCACFAYDGARVLGNPRSLAAAMTQCNSIDLTRRSPSYENRLSKYSHRGFEVHCGFLDRKRVDPSIFERSFGRTVGLARLLVLEVLPTPDEREKYVDQRKMEMGRPNRRPPPRWNAPGKSDLKKDAPDEVAEWDFEDMQSSYQRFSIPYGPYYHAKSIERLFFKKDLLLNAEWNPLNRAPHRTADLHRHQVFIGDVRDVIEDCCGFCPEPLNDEDREVAEKEDAIFVKGKLQFLEDDPGRQEIGSFYPLGPEEWTDMAYLGDTENLCHAIVENNVEYVREWCAQKAADVNRRDCCGRTPLHLAIMNETTEMEVVQTLIDRGARLVARLQDGRTSLHLAAARGRADMVAALLKKSAENENERDERENRQKQRKPPKSEESSNTKSSPQRGNKSDEEVSDADESYDAVSDASEAGPPTQTTESFVKIERNAEKAQNEDDIDDPEEDDDIFDLNVADWDFNLTALHHSIVAGHPSLARTLVSDFGANPLNPVKIYGWDWLGVNRVPESAILTPALSLKLSADEMTTMIRTLLEVGASTAQANSFNRCNLLHYAAADNNGVEALDAIFSVDEPAAKNIINNVSRSRTSTASPLTIALAGNPSIVPATVELLLSKGARAQITLEDYKRSLSPKQLSEDELMGRRQSHDWDFNCRTAQAIEIAIRRGLEATLVEKLLDAGANPSTVAQSTLAHRGYRSEDMPEDGQTVLEVVREQIRKCKVKAKVDEPADLRVLWDEEVLEIFPRDSYIRRVAEVHFWEQTKERRTANDNATKQATNLQEDQRLLEKKNIKVKKLLERLEGIENLLVQRGAQTYRQLYPRKTPTDSQERDAAAERREREEEERNAEREKKQRQEEKERDASFIRSMKVPFVQYSYKLSQEIDAQCTLPSEELQSLAKKDLARAGYIRLFSAVWDDDEVTVRRLSSGLSTLGDRLIPSLKVTEIDEYDHSALSIAVLRGHHRMVELLLEIAEEQFEELEEETTTRWGVDDSGFVADEVERDFIIEHKAEEHAAVSRVSRFAWLSRSYPVASFLGGDLMDSLGLQNSAAWSVLSYAIYKDDLQLITLLLKLADDAKPSGARSLLDNADHLRLALRLGRVSILEHFMRTFSFGIAYAALENADEELQKQRPKYYIGLSVRGAKKDKWVDRSFPGRSKNGDHTQKPAQIAAYYHNVDSLRWLMSERPWACLQCFLQEQAQTHHARLLRKQSGLEGMLRNGLGIETSLLPHLAIKGYENKELNRQYQTEEPTAEWRRFLETFTYLLSLASANGIETRTNLGLTVALYAVDQWRPDVIVELQKPEYSVDWTARDASARNALHIALDHDRLDLGRRVRDALEMLPATLLDGDAFMQRTKSGLTPLAVLLSKLESGAFDPIVLEQFLARSKGVELQVADEFGNLPIHTVFQRGWVNSAKILLEHAPHLLRVENANGRTPEELAQAQWLLEVVAKDPPQVKEADYSNLYRKGELAYDLELWQLRESKDDSIEKEDRTGARKLAAERRELGAVRRLATLREASELARRLMRRAERNQKPEWDGADILGLW